jgi:hypothetical protein
MVNYSTNLIDWGDAGTAYSAGYSYVAGQQPQDGYDNYLNKNVIDDLQHLISLTNARMESTKGVSRPSSPEDGELFYDTDGQVFEQYQNGSWVEIGTSGDLTTHINDTTNPHAVTAAQAGAVADVAASVDETHLSFDVATQVELDAHTTDQTNPHLVSPADISALALDGSNAMLANLDFAQNQACKMAFEVLTGDPTAPVTGQVWFRSDLSEMRLFDGTSTHIVTTTTVV